MRVLRVLYTHRTQGVGAEGAHVQGMYEAFRDIGHETAMDCLPGCNPSERPAAPAAGSGSPAAAAQPSLLKKLYWAVAETAPQIVFEGIELAYNVPLFFRLGWRCLRRRPGLMYERYSLNTFAPTVLCRLLRIPHALEVNDSVVIERSRPLKLKSLSAAIEGFCIHRANLVITITGKFRDQLLARFGGDPGKVMVLTNAVARARFDRPFDGSETRRRLGLEGAKVIGGTGQFLEWHGLQDLVEQLGPEAEALDVHFLFVGDGPARKDVMARAEALGIAGRVHFTGMMPIAQVPSHLAALDVAVIPRAAAHASPMKLIEYMGMGLPVVAPDLSSIREAMVGDENGRIFPAGDMAAMKAAVLEFLRDPAAAAESGRRARAHVFAELTWDIHARKVLKALGLPRGR